MATTAVATESRYKSFMKPVKFWKSSSPTKDVPEQTTSDPLSHQEQEERSQLQTVRKNNSYMPSFNFSKKSSTTSVPALTESGITEVYKLSIIDDAGMYCPPSPTLGGKRDHWIEVNEEDMMDFHLPSSECLTTHVGAKHDFFTPSTFVHTQPYIFPIVNMSDSSISVPSFVEDDDSEMTTSSNRSSASYL